MNHKRGRRSFLPVLLIAVAFVAVTAVSASAGSGKEITYQLERKAASAWKGDGGKTAWKIPLQDEIVDEMRFLAPGRMLVSLREDSFQFSLSDLIMVDTDNGSLLWRYSRAKLKGEHSFVLTLSDIIMFRVDYGSKSDLVAISTVNGKQLWSIRVKSGEVQILPIPGADSVLVSSVRKDKLTLTAYSVSSGKKVWSNQRDVLGFRVAKPLMLVGLNEFLLFETGVTKISGKTGEAVWDRRDLMAAFGTPSPQLVSGSLYLIDGDHNLVRIDTDTGNTVMSVDLPEDVTYTSIYLADRVAYLRGTDKGYVSGRKFYITAINLDTDKVAWSHADDKPSVSNFIQRGNRLYFATPSSLICVNANSGSALFSVDASRTGKDFPVGIISLKDRIVFVSEMIVAAYDPGTGKQVFRHGFTPVSNEAGIDGLGKYISKIQTRMKNPPQVSTLYGDLSRQSMTQSMVYQDQSNANWSRSRDLSLKSHWASGSSGEQASWDSWGASNQAQIDGAFSKASAQLSFHFAMWQLEASFNESIRQAANVLRLNRLNFIRRSILSAYVSAQFGDYLFRPSEEEGLIGVSLVHLPTGKMAFVGLSPPKEVFGLWNAIDPDKGVVYHQGLRRVDGSAGGVEFRNFLMATRIELP